MVSFFQVFQTGNPITIINKYRIFVISSIIVGFLISFLVVLLGDRALMTILATVVILFSLNNIFSKRLIISEIFDKQSILFGLNKASNSIKDLNCAVIVEGYMDVITAHQNKEKNVIASMGTAITEQQVNSIKRLAKDYILAMDSDTAGQSATLRSLESAWHVLDTQNNLFQNNLLNLGKPPKIKIAALPKGEDPDSLIKNK